MIGTKIPMAIRFVGSALILAVSLCAGVYAHADEPGTGEPVLEIRAVPDFEFDYEDISQARERRFKVQGPLDALYGDRVVVGDTTFFLNENCKMNGVREGDYVGLRLDENKTALEIMPIEAP